MTENKTDEALASLAGVMPTVVLCVGIVLLIAAAAILVFGGKSPYPSTPMAAFGFLIMGGLLTGTGLLLVAPW